MFRVIDTSVVVFRQASAVNALYKLPKVLASAAPLHMTWVAVPSLQVVPAPWHPMLVLPSYQPGKEIF